MRYCDYHLPTPLPEPVPRVPSARSAPALLLLHLFVLITTPVFAKEPATRPSANPAAAPVNLRFGPADPSRVPPQMANWFADLASTDGKIRDAAKDSLKGLARDDLPALRKLIELRRPLAPSQAVVLKDIVTQMYLSDDRFNTNLNGREGFLGIRPAEVAIGALQSEDQPGKEAPAPQPPLAPANQGLFPGAIDVVDPNQVCGILVMECMPGFAGARSLEDGDIILSIVERPNIRFRAAGEFSLAVRALGAGQKIHFDVLRRGQIIRVEVVLGPRPDDAEAIPGALNSMQKLLDRRASEVNDYWEAEFAPLLAEGVG